MHMQTLLYNGPAMETLIIVLAVFAAVVVLGSDFFQKWTEKDQEREG